MVRCFLSLVLCLSACTKSLESSEVVVSRSRFSLGSLTPLAGGDSEVLIASGTSVASLGRQRATWWVGDAPRSVALPNIPVNGARFSAAGDAILVGPGRIDLSTQSFQGNLAWLAPEGPPAPGEGQLELRAASWSPDGARAALLYDWAGPSRGARPEARVRLIAAGQTKASVATAGATDVLIWGDRVVVSSPEVMVLDMDGRVAGKLPRGRGAPVRLRAGLGGVVLLDLDGSLRCLDVAQAAVFATWSGPFVDVADVPAARALVAVDAQGRVHAVCLQGAALQAIGVAETRVLDARIAVTSDRRLILAGAGPIPVVAGQFEIDCGP
jgi:hypothetical protein